MGCSHGPYFWIERRNENRRSSFSFQCQTKLVKHIAFSFPGTLTAHNKITNHLFKEGVTHLVDSQTQRSPSDFITVADAQQQILLQTGRTVSRSTAARWIAQNNLGHKLPGHKGQWIVDGVLLEDFLRKLKPDLHATRFIHFIRLNLLEVQILLESLRLPHVYQ